MMAKRRPTKPSKPAPVGKASDKTLDDMSVQIMSEILDTMKKTGTTKTQLCEKLGITMKELNRRMAAPEDVGLREMQDIFTAMGSEMLIRCLDTKPGVYFLDCIGDKCSGLALVAANNQAEAEECLKTWLVLQNSKLSLRLEREFYKPRRLDHVEYSGKMPAIVRLFTQGQWKNNNESETQL